MGLISWNRLYTLVSLTVTHFSWFFTCRSSTVSALHLNSRTARDTALSRSRFLSSSAAAFIASTGLALATNPEECLATQNAFSENPRYVDKEMQMKYGESSGTNKNNVLSYCTYFVPIYKFFNTIVLLYAFGAVS
jgi:hypothetical protein